MEWASWDVRDLEGKAARDRDRRPALRRLGTHRHRPDRAGRHLEIATAPPGTEARLRHDVPGLARSARGGRGLASIATGGTAEAVFGGDVPARKPFGSKLTGAIVRTMKLEPGEEATARFVVTWHFPNLLASRHAPARRAGTALCHAVRLGRRRRPLSRQALPEAHGGKRGSGTRPGTTRRCPTGSSTARSPIPRSWRRPPAIASTNGRFYGWEGVGCCAGTCTHVWHYAQAVARLFPELERITREQVDYAGVGFDPKTGSSAIGPRIRSDRPSTARPAPSCGPIASTRCRPTTRS